MTKQWHDMTALELGAGIATGSIDPVALAEHFLDRIAADEIDRNVFITVTMERARAEAEAAAARATAGLRRGDLDGVPMAWKDLTDTAGIETTFASNLMRDRVPTRDALLLERATRAGMICIGKTNLSEFAYSGLGINPVFGTPAGAGSFDEPRCPGGSSSGAGTSLARGLAPAAIGSDTGGSVRIPAAWNGVVGLKTSIGRLPLDGILALSPSYDTIGPLTLDVADANAVFAVLDGGRPYDLNGASLAGVRLLAPTNVVFDDLDDAVGAAVERAMAAMSDAGAEIVHGEVPEFEEAFDVVARHGNIISAQGLGLWKDLLDARGDEMYERILGRFRAAEALSATDAEAAHLKLKQVAARYHARVAGFAAVVLPTVPILPPPIAALEADEDAYNAANIGCTRNTRLGNLLVTCGVSLPCHSQGEMPVGLQLMGAPDSEGGMLRLAKAAEDAIAPTR